MSKLELQAYKHSLNYIFFNATRFGGEIDGQIQGPLQSVCYKVQTNILTFPKGRNLI